MLSRYQRTISRRYLSQRWHKGLSHLWYSYHKKMFGFLIVRGLKLKAYKRFSRLLTMVKKKERIEPRYLFLITCLRVTPTIAIKKLHKGSRIVFKPVPLSPLKQPGYVIKSFIKPLRDAHIRRNARLVKIWELLTQSLRRRGDVHKKKMQIYKTARVTRKPKMHFPRPKRVLRAKTRWNFTR